jgi:hypothetical protein
VAHDIPEFDKDQTNERAGQLDGERFWPRTKRPDREPGTAPDGEAMPPEALDPKPDDGNPADFDDTMAGNPDREPGRDSPKQRPLTDNKAGG